MALFLQIDGTPWCQLQPLLSDVLFMIIIILNKSEDGREQVLQTY